ncbi:MAG: sugar ABC transporter ATP-binding protein [Phycisphaerales bacterium]|nr:sugar ABC transporter ATP-binding protein [Phycisphaerales bacterium]
MTAPLLSFDGISKRFPGVQALSDVSFEIAVGEVHAIVGENGAGKSTLGKIVAGIYTADEGEMRLNGRRVVFASPLEAGAAGISVVHQELAYCPNLSIAENLFLGQMPARAGFVRNARMRADAARMLERVQLRIDPDTRMEHLSTAQVQLVQIAMALGRDAKVVIMDEPTSSLSQAETQRLYEIVGQLRASGVSVMYVSHRMEEIFRLSDRVSVLRDGRYVGTVSTRQSSPDEIVRMMIGRDVADYLYAPPPIADQAELLRVERLCGAGRFQDVSLTVAAGEVVGIAGLVGAGRSELARAIFGVDHVASGAVRLEGRVIQVRSPRDAIRCGIGLLPEDRKLQGLILSMNCRENTSLALLDRLRSAGFVRRAAERAVTQEYFAKLRVRTPHIDAPIAGLSGGNQQKIALAKWLARQCHVLILDEPTRGVDVAAKAEIHRLIGDLAAAGHAVLLISSEMPELLALSSRVLVMREGRIVGELSRDQATQEAVMRLMANVSNPSAAG